MIRAIFLFPILITSILSSECELSEWSRWSRCYGTCYYALSVRNRDVIRPSIPENSADRVKRCAKLYETRFCSLQSCQDSPVATTDLQSRSGHHWQPTKMIHKKNLLRGDHSQRSRGIHLTSMEELANEISHTEDRKETKQLEDIGMNKMFHSHNMQTLEAHERNNMMNHGSKKTHDLIVGAVTSDLERRLKPAREQIAIDGKRKWRFSEDIEDLEAAEEAVHDNIRDLESVAHYRIPLSDEPLRKMLVRNKLLMKTLIEAHQLHTTPSTIPQTKAAYFAKKQADITTTKAGGERGTITSVTEKDSSSFERESTSTAETSTPYSNFTTELFLPNDVIDISLNDTNKNKDQRGFMNASMSFLQTRNDDSNGNNTAIYDQSKNGGNFTDMEFSKNLRDSIETIFDSEDNINCNTTSLTNSLATIMDKKSENHNKSPLFKLFNLGKITNITTELTTASTFTTITTPSPSPYWPKKGYVPNTRKHASEITSKLYMTQEIIQALSDVPIRRSSILRLDCLESRRCCRITRTQCSDGSIPKYVKRYYRPRGAETCMPYYYPRCSHIEEMDEQPIHYEQNCQDICFSGSEKRISPLFQLAIEN